MSLQTSVPLSPVFNFLLFCRLSAFHLAVILSHVLAELSFPAHVHRVEASCVRMSCKASWSLSIHSFVSCRGIYMQTLLSFVHRFLLVAARPVLGGPELVHLSHALLELFVLALLVGVALVL
jgi:hypothetical protein